jgi:hypothetical protein
MKNRISSLICLILIFSCNKNSIETPSQNNSLDNTSLTPSGFKIDSAFNQNNNSLVSISWAPVNVNAYKSIKIYRGLSPSTSALIATTTATESKFVDSNNVKTGTVYYYKISAVNIKDKESNFTNELNITTPQLKQKLENNSFELSSVTNLVLAEGSSSIFEFGNVLALDSNGKSSSLKIPDAKSYSLIVNYMVPCTKSLLYLNGSLTVQYNSGKIQSYRNFILDTKTGSFYQLENDFGALWSRTGSRKTPWVNGTIQYDANENIYIQSKVNALIQEMTKFSFVKTSDSTIRVTTNVFNLIGESYYFNYFILPSGDIFFMNKENMSNMAWKIRFNSGATKDISLTQGKPLVISGKTYFSSVNTSKCFIINDSKGQPIIFVNGDSAQIAPINIINAEKYMPFYIKINGSDVTFQPVGTKYFDARIKSSIVNGPLTTNADLFTDYYHGMWYFPKGSNHIFTNRGYGGSNDPSTWWKYDDTNNSITLAFLPFSPIEFTTYSNLTTRSYDNAFVIIKRDIYSIDLNDFKYIKTPSINYQIYLTSYVGDGRVQFYGISYLTGNKVLGEFNKNGDVKLIKEFDNSVTIKDIVKIGTF